MCVCACASVSVCLPIKGDSRFGDSLDSCCLLCSLRGDEQMVCWSVVRRTHAGPHTHTQTQIRTCMLYPVTLALSSIYLFHYTSLCRTMPLCELWGGGLVCVWERQKGCEAVWMKWQTEPLRWSSQKADDSLAHWLLWIIAIHSSAALYSARIACKGGIVFLLLICPCPGNKTRHIWTRSRERKIWLVSHATIEGKVKWLSINERILVHLKRKSNLGLQMFQSKEMIYDTLITVQYLHSLQNVWYCFSLCLYRQICRLKFACKF